MGKISHSLAHSFTHLRTHSLTSLIHTLTHPSPNHCPHPLPPSVAVGCIYGFTVVDFLKGDIIHIQSTYDSSEPEAMQMSRMQSIRRSFRQSLKRLNIRHSMRGTQSTQRSYRPSNFVRSGSARPSVAKSRRVGGAATLTTPPKRDLIKTLTFTAPCQIAGNCVYTRYQLASSIAAL